MKTNVVICDLCGKTVQVGRAAYYEVKMRRNPASLNMMSPAVRKYQICTECSRKTFNVG